MAVSFKGAHFPPEIILTGIRWYVAYPLSKTRHVAELMLERGVHVDHATINWWVIKYSPPLERRSTAASGPSGSAGGWMRRIFGSKGSGSIYIGRWIRPARPLISCSRSTGIQQRRSGF